MTTASYLRGIVGVAICGAALCTADARAGAANEKIPPALRKQVAASIARGLSFLETTREAEGGWVQSAGPAISAMVGKCFAQDPKHGPDHPIVRHTLAYVLKFRQPDGGIYDTGFGMRNYTTSVCLMFLSSLPKSDPDVARARAEAVKFLKNLQWAEHRKDAGGKPITPEHVWYGGAGYGRHKRPDLSNTQMMLEALKQSELPASDPTYKKALRFIERCQMSSETNDQPFARNTNDGGFIYTCAKGGESKAGTVVVDGQPMLRSYGSMTYAGLKSMLYADVSRDDPRVRGALAWIGKHYTLDENPNLPGKQSKQGLYYYYHVFAKALDAYGQDVLVDVKKQKHAWRADLCRKLVSLQRRAGHWVNDADRWMEGMPALVTAYSILALQTAMK